MLVPVPLAQEVMALSISPISMVLHGGWFPFIVQPWDIVVDVEVDVVVVVVVVVIVVVS